MPAKQLLLLRHAKSSWDDASLPDHDRPLAARGRRAADLMGAHLRAAAVAPAIVLCSTSARTRETLERIAPALDPAVEVLFERDLYGASAERLLRRLRTLPDDAGSAMLIAHSSGIEDLALLLARRGHDLGALREKFPTCALATLAFSGRWRSLGPREAELVSFVTPRALEGDATRV